MRKRDIDIAKGIGITLMVVGHCYHQSNWLLKLIYAFHMPFFFMITGILYSEQIWRMNFVKQIRRLLVPYFVFDSAYNFFISFMGIRNGIENVLKKIVKNLGITLKMVGVNALWYLPCLLISELLLFFLDKAGKIKYPLFLILLLVGLFVPVEGWYIVLWRGFVGTGFMAVGYYGKKYLLKPAKGYILLCATVIFALSGLANISVSLVSLKFGNPILYMISSVTGSYLLLQLCVILDRELQNDSKICRVVTYIGQNTIVILCTHILIIEIIRFLDYKVFDNILYSFGFFEGIVFALLIMLCELCVIPLSNKWFYYLFGQTQSIQ